MPTLKTIQWAKNFRFSFFLILILTGFAAAQEHSYAIESPRTKVKWKNRARVRSLQNFDEFLNWTIPIHMRKYALVQPPELSSFQCNLDQARDFIEWYGFFSFYEPLVGKVSKRKGDLQIARSLMVKAAVSQLATDEILAKVMAYRDMKIHDEILIASPESAGQLVVYRVDHVFNLWRGMPAFGLIGEQKAAPILLFRGTDFSLDSERGWASLMSDVDISGPGLRAFNAAREEIRSWLMKVAKIGPKAKVIGFSLGASLAAYTYLYENEWVNPQGSVVFNPPGFSDQVLKDWSALQPESKNGFRVYVNRGDLVSKIGKLFGDAYECSLEAPLKPLRAHTLLLCAEPRFFQAKIDLEKENSVR